MEIECVFQGLKWAETRIVKAYTCKVTSCNITDRASAIASFKGNHKGQKSNKLVKALWFQNTKVHYIPRNLTQIFPNLAYLYIYNCELKEISSDDLIGLEKLKTLDLPGNKITTLPVDLFQNMKNLQEVNFSKNLVQDFDVKILDPIRDKIECFGILRNPGVNEVFNKTKADVGEFIERWELRQSKKIDSQRFKDLLERLKLLESKENYSQRLGDVCTSDKYSDFTIRVQDKEYRVHKNVLALQSTVFNKMFSDDVGATSKTFDNTGNFSEEAVEEFVRFLYNKTAPSKENVSEVLKLAIEFDVPRLKQQCESDLVQTIDPQSARKLYNLAVQNSLPRLKRKSFEAIQKCHPDVLGHIYDMPALVNQLIDAREEFRAKKMKLEKDE